MTQTIDKLIGGCTPSTRLLNPHEINVSSHLSVDESEVEKVIKAFNSNGEIPEIIVTESGELVKGVDAVEAAIRLNQQMVMVFVEAEKISTSRNLTLLPIEALYTHPLNASIYGEGEDLTRLREAIATSGWVKPLLVTPDGNGKYKVIDGNSCFKVCAELGISEVRVDIVSFDSEEEELEALLSANIAREKTILQKVREGQLWEEIERRKAIKRKKSGNASHDAINLMENFPHDASNLMENFSYGATRDIVAKRVGIGSGKNYEHAKKCVQALDESADAPPGTARHQQHEQLRQLLSRPRGVDAAYKLIAPVEGKGQETKQGREEQRWIPNELTSIKIIRGPHQGSTAMVTVVLPSKDVMVHLDGTPESERKYFKLSDIAPLEISREENTSTKQEIQQQQQDLGLGKRTQILPDKPTNTGIQPAEQMQASATNLELVGDVAVAEIAIALLRLTPKQIYEVMRKAEPDMNSQQLDAIWKAFAKSFAHKAA